jgi:glycerol uptake facilitator-like aquaporin
MKKITKIILATIIGLFGFCALTVPTYAYDICTDSNVPEDVRAASGCSVGNVKNISDVVSGILNGVIGMLGLVAVAFIIVGGVNYMTSAGDPGKTKKAKDTILYACIGLIVCALAFAITNFTINIINHAGDNTSGSSSEEPAPDKPVKPGEVEQYEK